MDLFSIQKVTSEETAVSGTFYMNYTPVSGTLIEFEDNPGMADMWNVPRRQEHIYTMNIGGVNIDLGTDRSKQSIKLTVSAASKKFYNDVMSYYLYDEPDTIYLLTNHVAENWVVKWKDISAKLIGTLPLEFSGTVPIPSGMDSTTPFKYYSDVYELSIEFAVADYNVNV